MNIFKKLISLLLTGAMFFSLLFIETSAEVTPVGNGMKRIEAEDYATVNYCTNPRCEAANYSGGYYVGGCSVYSMDWDYLPTYESIGEYLHKSNTAYVSYTVIAPEDGEYSIMPSAWLGDSVCEGYFFTILVNKNDTYKIYPDTKVVEEKLNVFLKKGRNVIRCIPYTYEWMSLDSATRPTWCNHDFIDIDERLTAVLPSSVRLEAEESIFYNRFNAVSDRLGGAQNSYMQEVGITVDTLTHDRISDVSYFSYTLDFPETGYYDMTVSFNTEWQIRDDNFALLIDDGDAVSIRYKKAKSTEESFSKNMADFSAYLTAGTHVLTFVAQIPKSDPGAVYQWTDFDALTVYGGAGKSAFQINPKDLSIRMEAETDSVYQNYNSVEAGSTYSGGYALGNAELDYNKLQKFESLNNYFDKSNNLYVSVTVKAPEEGDYMIRPVYYISNLENISGGYYCAVQAANKAYRAPYSSSENNGWNDLGYALVHLEKGVNVIRCVPGVYETKEAFSGGYINFDCIDIDGRLEAVLPYSDGININSSDSEYINKFDSINPGESIGGADISVIRSTGRTFENLTLLNISDAPYFSLTVDAEEDGYYDITVYFSSESLSTSHDEDCLYFGLAVDNNIYPKGFRRKTDNSNSFEDNKADFTEYLTAGTHVLTFICQMPLADPDDGYLWTDFEYVDIRGNIELSFEQKSPVPNISQTFEAEAGTTYKHRFGQPMQSMPTASDGYQVGGAYNSFLPTYESLTQNLEQSASYIAYAIYADESGDYAFRLRFEVGCMDNDNAKYQEYTEQYGRPYAALIVNGDTAYKVEHITNSGWISDSNNFYMHLNKGVNIIYCMGMTSDLFNNLEGAYINYDCLYAQEELRLASGSFAVPGDANDDEEINIKDLIRIKKFSTDNSTPINYKSANLTGDKDVNGEEIINSEDIALIQKYLLDKSSDDIRPLTWNIFVPSEDITAVVSSPDQNSYMNITEAKVYKDIDNSGAGSTVINVNSKNYSR